MVRRWDGSFILHLRPSLQIPVLMNLLHNGVHFRVVHPAACGAQYAFAPLPGRLNDRHLDHDFLSLVHSQVFIQFDGLAVDLPMNCLGHGLPPSPWFSVMRSSRSESETWTL